MSLALNNRALKNILALRHFLCFRIEIVLQTSHLLPNISLVVSQSLLNIFFQNSGAKNLPSVKMEGLNISNITKYRFLYRYNVIYTMEF